MGFGGGSSGGTTGTVDYPDYMKAKHLEMLENTYNKVYNATVVHPTLFYYDPRVWLGQPANQGLYTVITEFGALDVDALLLEIMSSTGPSPFVFSTADVEEIKTKAEELRALITSTPEAATDEMIDAFSAKLLERVESDVIPKIEVGMRDANAVIGSSFVIAKEIAMEHYTTEVSEFAAKAKLRFWELRYDLYKTIETMWIDSSLHLVDLGMKRLGLMLEHKKIYEGMISEASNLSITAMTKFGIIQSEHDIRNIEWPLIMQDYMNKSLAAISGASPIRAGTGEGSQVMSGIAAGAGGALSGAAAGLMMSGGNPLGGVIGGAIGLLGGLFGARK